MKISHKSSTVTFESINYGECFVSDGIEYMKTEPDLQQQLPAYGCSLECGNLKYFKGSDLVKPLNMEVIER